MRITNTIDATGDHGVKILVYGRSGVGKTVLCATAPAPLLISAESGLLSLTHSNIARVYGEGTEGVSYSLPVVTIRDVAGLVDTYNWLSSSAEAKQYQTVCLDSLTEIAETVLTHAKSQVKDPRQAYGELIEKMTGVIRSFRDLPGKHVYMSAKQEKVQDSDTGLQLYGPSMPGNKLAQGLPYFFDEVACLRIGKTSDGKPYRYLQTAPDPQYEAKDRSGALDPIEYPHLGYIFRKIGE